MQGKRNRFQVIEYSTHYSVLDTVSGKSHVMSDGVDVLSTPTGRTMAPGSEYFRKTWEKALNENLDETAEAYDFPRE